MHPFDLHCELSLCCAILGQDHQAQCAAVSTAPRPTTTFAETAKGRCGCVMPNNFVGVMKDRPVLIMGKQKAPTKQPMQSNAILSPVP